MCDHVAYQDDLHVFPGEWQRIGTGSEKGQDRIQEEQAHGSENHACYAIEADVIGQHLVGGLIIALPEQHRDQGRRSDTDQCAESGTEVHQGKSDSQAGQG